jgi:hypothetical protein
MAEHILDLTIEVNHNEREFLSGYLEAMFFAETDESDESGGIPLDSAGYGYEDISDESMRSLAIDCMAFLRRYGYMILADDCEGDIEGAGRDFYYTRTGHGTGFWDRDEHVYGPYADELTKAAKAAGERYVIVESGTIYVA